MNDLNVSKVVSVSCTKDADLGCVVRAELKNGIVAEFHQEYDKTLASHPVEKCLKVKVIFGGDAIHFPDIGYTIPACNLW